MIARRVLYFGRVQGVGFRYGAQALAQQYDVAGFVRNLPDGRVELVAEGPPDRVEALIEAIGRRMAGYVERSTIEPIAIVGYGEFVIQR